MWNFQFVCHQLESMFAVSFSQILMKLDAVTDSQYGIRSVYGKENDVSEISGKKDKFAESEEYDKCHRNRADISGEAFCFLPEIEEKEYKYCHTCHPKEWHVNEMIDFVKVDHWGYNGKRVGSCDAVDAVHEIISVDNAYADNESHDYNPPIMPVEDTELSEHEEHSDKLNDKPCLIGERTDIIYKTDASDKGKTQHKP